MTQPIKIAILAMGGEGGGVLADWIVDLGEANGHLAQTTSVPGVAQRTGATIYYVELYPRAQAEADGAQPVLALMPLPGDVDVVLASELMEAGRAVQRGLVTKDRTTLIASTHRVYSIAEKSALGDGRVDPTELLRHAQAAAQRFIRFDMALAAEQAGSVISAVLFGALAGAGVLPFGRAAFEATITRGGVGVKPSLKAFGAAFDRARQDTAAAEEPAAATVPQAAPQPRHPAVKALVDRVQQQLAGPAQDLVLEGVRRLVDYQDPAYAALYLDRMAALLVALKRAPGGGDALLLRSVARHLALWMSYEDTARVADLKTRGTRFERVRGEVRLEASLTASCWPSTSTCTHGCRRSARRCRPASAAG
jgi:indolepyruvate ferredoxin oxidoreductase, beta subunit